MIGGQRHEIEVRPITLVVQSAESAVGPPIEYPGCMVLDPEATTYHGKRVQKVHAEFGVAWRHFMASCQNQPSNFPVTPDEIRKGGSGGIHLMGLIDLSLKFQDMKVSVVWRHPESFLHPAWQVGLA